MAMSEDSYIAAEELAMRTAMIECPINGLKMVNVRFLVLGKSVTNLN